ncbi:hypothetical protein [Sulfitobacter guttiformis]|uniref:Uncharacterized protein n=1 Tax=Sulfitobacter guttiformis TaxID=74349 RepID=A0A420DQ52_9RHOB|nr:hypothetical protein [Sulfitobacter guttiformis]KIN73665.1 hypothetical protein Z949_2857 [Sulfitobacter guttiformis KCTC 32187]RKE96308.1 hypothetical protein C8N30_0866 [Sulfitobacter guttiformis]
MNADTLILPFSITAFVYLIVTLQVQGGLPPLYRRFDVVHEKDLIKILPAVFSLIFMMLFAVTGMRLFLFAFGWCTR